MVRPQQIRPAIWKAPTSWVGALALLLAACGEDGSSPPANPGPPSGGTPAPTPTPPPNTACSLRAQQDFADRVLRDWYLFPNLLAQANPANFNSVQGFLNARVAPARAQNRDRFTFATSIAEENALIARGESAGFGIDLGFDKPANNRVTVLEAYEGGSGLAAGIDRGTELLAIGVNSANMQTVTSLMASGGPQAVSDALGPLEGGVTRILRFQPAGGAIIERSVTKTVFSLDPISNRYGTIVFNDNGRLVGYLNLRTFNIADASRQLREAFGRFHNAGVSDIIIDLRYNGGGLLEVADVMGDLLIGRGRVGQPWSRTIGRPERQAEIDRASPPRNLRQELNAVGDMRFAFITTGNTASASEIVINSLLPYISNRMVIIGSNTFGKPVGSGGFDLAACDLRVRPVTFKTVNALGQGDYFDGLASVVPITCEAADDIHTPLGDPREASIRTAFDVLRGRSCTAMTRMQSDRSSIAPERAMTNAPTQTGSAVQFHIPGFQ
jgi:carboxyl-terminal processing protease